MTNQEAVVTLSHYAHRYGRFAEHWAKAKEGIKATLPSRPDAPFVLEGYEVEQEEREEGSAIHFRLFGARCYVAFTHNLEKGTLEYGVIDPMDPDQRRRIRCSALEFEVNGNLGEVGTPGPWSIFESQSVQSAHLTKISQIAPQLVRTFYDAYHDREPSE